MCEWLPAPACGRPGSRVCCVLTTCMSEFVRTRVCVPLYVYVLPAACGGVGLRICVWHHRTGCVLG